MTPLPIQSPAAHAQPHAFDLARAVAELATLPVSLFGRLPVETRLLTQGSVSKSVFVLSSAPTTTRSRLAATWFEADEIEAMAWAARVERMFASDLISFALRKLHDPGFKVTLEHALSGASATVLDEQATEPTLGEMLDALELTVIGIEIGPVVRQDAVPARRAA